MNREDLHTFEDEHAGDFFVVPMDGEFAFGRHQGAGLFAFYDFKSARIPSLDELQRIPIAFSIGGDGLSALTSGRWRVIGHRPLERALRCPTKFYQRISGTDYLHIYSLRKGGFQPYAGEDLTKMLPLMIYDVRHFEDRLRAHFAGESYLPAEHDALPLEFAERFRREYFKKLAAKAAPHG